MHEHRTREERERERERIWRESDLPHSLWVWQWFSYQNWYVDAEHESEHWTELWEYETGKLVHHEQMAVGYASETTPCLDCRSAQSQSTHIKVDMYRLRSN